MFLKIPISSFHLVYNLSLIHICIVADNIVFGNKKKYPGSIGTSIAKVFDLTVAAAGANAKLLQQNNIPYISSYTHGASHAGYYPGAVPLSIKILFAPENGKLLGAQIVGFNGVDKRIEMLAQVIQRGGTVHDLAELEHAYACLLYTSGACGKKFTTIQ